MNKIIIWIGIAYIIVEARVCFFIVKEITKFINSLFSININNLDIIVLVNFLNQITQECKIFHYEGETTNSFKNT
jgi:hypothetical protein